MFTLQNFKKHSVIHSIIKIDWVNGWQRLESTAESAMCQYKNTVEEADMILLFFLRKMSHRCQWICVHCDPRKLRRTKTKNWSENGKEKYCDTAFQSVYEETTLPAPLTMGKAHSSANKACSGNFHCKLQHISTL